LHLYSFCLFFFDNLGVDDTPLMTWGEIDGTPFRLDGDDDPALADAPVFKIPEVPIRDRIANSMNDTIGKRYTDKRKTALAFAAQAHPKTPKFGTKRSQLAMGLSPAAKNLLHQKLGIKIGSAGNSRKGTPSIRSIGSSSTRSTTSSFTSTPNLRSFIRTSKQMQQPPTPDHDNSGAVAAVSGLLNLELPQKLSNSRPKAVDFD
jgi:protein DGCR14